MFQDLDRTLAFSILASFGFHVFFLFFYQSEMSKHSFSQIEFEVVDPSRKPKDFLKKKENKMQIVEQNKNPLNKEAPVHAKYLSRFNQRVEVETKASAKGNDLGLRFKRREAKSVSLLKNKFNSTDSIKKIKSKNFSKDSSKNLTMGDLRPRFYEDIASRSIAEDIALRSIAHEKLMNPPLGVSHSSNFLKDVSKGSRTLLNTREFVYYTYYQRIKKKLRYYWSLHLEGKVKNARRNDSTFDLFQVFITQIIAILDLNGSLVRVQVIGKSGLIDLDEAALNAFRDAGPFPNPPAGMVNQEGQVKIRWDFVLEKS